MSITKRFIYLLLFGAVILTFSLILDNSFIFFILYNAIAFMLLITDYLISKENGRIFIERTGHDSLSLYENEKISFEVYNKSERELYIELKDEIPEHHFKFKESIMSGKVPPHNKSIFSYEVMPTKRGAFTFRKVHARYQGKLKLCMINSKIRIPREFKVYPNMKNLRKYRLGITNNRSFKQGQRNLRMLGRGTSFESLREYTAGDEYRKINWKATARGNKPIVNQYEPEKNQHVHIFIDTRRPMSYTLKGYRKLDMVVNTALVLSDVVNQNGDESGLLLFNREVNSMIMPGKGPEHRNKILEALYHIDHTNETSNYEDAFFYFKRKERHRSIIFLFTDFDTLEEAEYILKVLPMVSKNNIVVIVLIKNESLEAISGEKASTKEEIFNKGVALELLDERQKIISLLNRKGILCIECPAEKLEYTVVNRYIQVKNRTYM
ncbi:DUF58 domain-containing protein [Clostridium polynesiense]|uniref:DUF58 domain-containing protein n=1 Tax=Clostridium polynesiense TaxID=1325933 RepID=UPI000590E9EC|nr:DUF58 domain-containing protein [Clostridium polynesiense]